MNNLIRRKFLKAMLILPVSALLSKKIYAGQLNHIVNKNEAKKLLQKAIPEEMRHELKRLTQARILKQKTIESTNSWWTSFITNQHANEANIAQLIEKEIQKDFSQKRTEFTNGWLISDTEVKLSQLVRYYS